MTVHAVCKHRVAIGSVLSLLLLTGCSGHRLAPVAGLDAAGAAVEEAGKTEPLQALFRVHYGGAQGSGSFKLVLRWESDSRFELAATDRLGRSLWRMTLVSRATMFVDERRDLYCCSSDLRLDEPALRSLSVRAVPRVLLGDLPGEIEEGLGDETSGDVRDGAGRRWSVRVGESGVESWTLWHEKAPILWWQRQRQGGILSHRDGSQFRWRLVAREPLAESIELPRRREGLSLVTCRELNLLTGGSDPR